MIEKLLSDRADAMAAQDGVPTGTVHLHGAANQLQTELLSARDRLIHAPRPEAASAPDAATPKRKARTGPVLAALAGDAEKSAVVTEPEPEAEVEAPLEPTAGGPEAPLASESGSAEDSPE